MKIVTWNVNGIRARSRSFLEWMRVHRPDIICLQEIKAHPDQIPADVKDVEGYHSMWHGSHGGYSGVSIHVRNGSLQKPSFSVPFFDEETRIVQAELGETVVVNVYIPLGQKDFGQKLAFLDSLIKYVDALRYEGKQILLCGDLNVAHTDNDVHPEMLEEGRLCTTLDERLRLDAFQGMGLTDLFRKHHPNLRNAYSWWPYYGQARKRNVGWRIDYIYACPTLAPLARDCRIQKEETSSDHSPVIAEIELNVE